MPTAVPITFPNQQRPGAHGSSNGSFVDNPVMISPNMPWRGSPMSYNILARSLGTKNSFSSFMGTSPGPLSAAFSELNDFRVNGIPSSIESEAGKILRALHGEESLNKELIQNYSCCGTNLPDLHALLEHFEEVHVVVLDSPSLRPTTAMTATGAAATGAGPSSSGAMEDDNDDDDSNEPQSAFDPDAMDLDSGPSSSSGSTPPSTPPLDMALAASSSAFDTTTTNLVIRTTSRALSKAAASGSMSGYNTPRGISPHPTTPGGASAGIGGGIERSEPASLFNPYASYSDFSALMPGTVRTPIHQSPPSKNNSIKGGDHHHHHHGSPSSPTSPSSATASSSNGANPTMLTSIPPALLFSPSTQTTPNGSPMHSRTGTPTPGNGGLSRAGSLSGAAAGGAGGGGVNGSGGLTSASLMSLANHHHHHHPYSNGSSAATGSGKKGSMSGHSSTPGASTSSSSNGNGGGNGSGSSSLVSKPFRCPTVGCNKSYKQANGLKYHITHGQCNFMPRDPSLEGLNESEADEKARPYVCQVGSCTRRYKNMNGLRYHYQHSGQHGAVGLALLASGQHSLQTGLKDAGLEIPPQVREQNMLAAQALHRQQQQATATGVQPQSQSSSTTTTPTLSNATPMPMTATAMTMTTSPQYLSQLQQQQAQAQKQQQQAEQASRLQREREQEAMAAHIQQRLPAQKTPPNVTPSVLTQQQRPGLSMLSTGSPAPAVVRREPESFAMQM